MEKKVTWFCNTYFLLFSLIHLIIIYEIVSRASLLWTSGRVADFPCSLSLMFYTSLFFIIHCWPGPVWNLSARAANTPMMRLGISFSADLGQRILGVCSRSKANSILAQPVVTGRDSWLTLLSSQNMASIIFKILLCSENNSNLVSVKTSLFAKSVSHSS